MILVVFLFALAASETLNDLIYTKVNFGDTICFRMNNFNSQTGCQTGRDGDNGILYPVQSENGLADDLQTLDIPIIAVLNASLFTNTTITALKAYSQTKGVLIMEEEDIEPQSMEKSCPGNGYNIGESASDVVGRQCLNSHKWNPLGNWLMYYDLPFGVSLIEGDEREKVTSRAFQNLGSDGKIIPTRRWGGEIKVFMNAAQDTKTSSETLNDLIYTKVNFGDTICFRMNNFNSQTGCQTGRDGDNGILYPVQSENGLADDLQTLDIPIIAVLNASLFTNTTITALKAYSQTKGVLIMEEEDIEPQSMEKSCPGNGYNIGESASDVVGRQCLNSHKWNPLGNWLMYYDLPFGVSLIEGDEREKVTSRAFQNLGSDGKIIPTRRWGGEIKVFMNAAQDTKTCIRRGTCDPISGITTHVFMAPREVARKPVILIVTKADAAAFFKSLSYGGEASAASIAVALGTIGALANVRDNDSQNNFADLECDIMVSFLQAESWDYSGSQRLAYDLRNESFGYGPYNISLSDVKLVIEIGPISISNSLYIHSYKVDDTVTQARGYFTNTSGLVFTPRDTLPPSSLHSFYREDDDLSGLLVTDTDSKLLSSAYGSRYDILDYTADDVELYSNLSGVLASVVLQMAGGNSTTYAVANSTLISETLECLAVNKNCTLLRDSLNQDPADGLLSRYSSVGIRNDTKYLILLAQYYSKTLLENIPVESCNSTTPSSWYLYKFQGSCYGTMVNTTYATSPAFVLGNYTSDQYSTWTESRWTASYGIRLFTVTDHEESVAVFVGGVVYFVVLSAVIWQCHRKREHIFSET
eukprot:sb/3462163/